MKVIISFLVMFFTLIKCNDKDIFSNKRNISPEIIYSFPQQEDSSDFKLNSSILVTFDTDMDKTTIITENFILTNNLNENVLYTIETYGERGVIIYPVGEAASTNADKASFLANAQYGLTIDKRVRDISGNSLEETFKINFETGENEDKSLPRIDENLVTLQNNIIKIYFNEPINPISINKSIENSTVELIDEEERKINTKIYYIAEESAVFIEPEIILNGEIKYNLNIKANSFYDMARNYLNKDYSFSFFNGRPMEDLESPEVVDVESDFAVIIEFSENIDPSTVVLEGANPSIILTDLDQNKIESGYFTAYLDGTKKIVLVPRGDKGLKITNFTGLIKITTNVADLNGNFLERDQVFCFGQYTINEKSDLAFFNKSKTVFYNSLTINSDQIINLDELGELYRIDEGLTINNCDLLEDISALKNLKIFNGNLIIYSNQNLLSLNGLDNIITVQTIAVSENNQLTNLIGLSGLKEVVDEIQIIENNNLTSIDQLNNIKNLGTLRINLNGNLESDELLKQLKDVSNVYITSNYKLRDSVINEFLNRLNPGGTVNISDNLNDSIVMEQN